MNNPNFGAIHYDLYLDMKLDFTIKRIFQEMSLPELETLHQSCELERTQILQSLALAVIKIPNAGYFLSSFHRSTSYPANLQSYLPIIPLFVFPPT